MIRTSTYGRAFGAALLFAGFAASAAQAAEPKAHSDTVVAAITDTAITAKVKARLMGEDKLKQSNISVTTTNGVVALHGSASNVDARALAADATRSVEGVLDVDNDLTTPTVPTKTQVAVAKSKRVVSDSWITTKVKSEILADSVSKGFDVSVTTRRGVVALKGTLADDKAVEHVKKIALKVKGVKRVNTTELTATRT